MWIEVDGKALTEFGLRVEGAKATCLRRLARYSQAFLCCQPTHSSSQAFVVKYERLFGGVQQSDKAVILSLDGVMIQGEGILRRVPATQQLTIDRANLDGKTSRPFVFANCQFTGQWCVSFPPGEASCLAP